MPFVIINFSLADLIGVGFAVPVSVSLGKKEIKRADIIFICACIMIVGDGVLSGTVLIVFLWPLGLTGIWLNFAGTSVLAGIMSFVIKKSIIKNVSFIVFNRK